MQQRSATSADPGQHRWTLLVALVASVLAVVAVPATAQGAGPPGSSVGLLSVNAAGSDSGDNLSTEAVVSADGSTAAFVSYASDLVPGGVVPVTANLYVRDLATGATTLVSTGVDGGGGDGESRDPRLSADGSVVVFHSEATNLTDDVDDNGGADVFVHDRRTGATTLVSHVVGGGATGDDASDSAEVSADGSTVVYQSYADGLEDVSNDVNRLLVHAYDVATDTNDLVSATPAGGRPDDWSFNPQVSADGDIVVFSSQATDLVSGPTNNSVVYVRDRDAGTTTVVPVRPGTTEHLGFAVEPAVSADGTVVAWYHDGEGVTADPDGNGRADAFVTDLTGGDTTLVSTDIDGRAAGTDDFYPPRLSADGSTVVFYSEADDVAMGDNGNGSGVFAHDIATGKVEMVSTADGPSAAVDGEGFPGWLSADGRFVSFTFVGDRPLTAEADDNDRGDVYLRDRSTGTTRLLSRSRFGASTGNGDSISFGSSVHGPSVSADGSVVTFESTSTDLAERDTNSGNFNPDVFVTPRLPVPPVTRFAGSTREDTAAQVALASFDPAEVDTVFLATGRNFPDALAGGPLASVLGAPILLTGAGTLTDPTADALATLRPDEVVALGGTTVVPDDVLADAAAAAGGATTDRLFGASRYGTAAAIAQRLDTVVGASTVYLTTGVDFPDAMAAGPATDGAPILLALADRLPAETAAVLADLQPERVVALGGDLVLSDTVLARAAEHAGGATTDRLGGQTRYDTALQIADLVPSPSTVFVAVGSNYPDALAAAPSAATAAAPIVLTGKTELPERVETWLQSRPDLDRIVILGGDLAVSQDVQRRLEAIMGG